MQFKLDRFWRPQGTPTPQQEALQVEVAEGQQQRVGRKISFGRPQGGLRSLGKGWDPWGAFGSLWEPCGAFRNILGSYGKLWGAWGALGELLGSGWPGGAAGHATPSAQTNASTVADGARLRLQNQHLARERQNRPYPEANRLRPWSVYLTAVAVQYNEPRHLIRIVVVSGQRRRSQALSMLRPLDDPS